MHPQLQAIVDELDSAQARLKVLAAATAPKDWSRQPAPARWSIGECVAHLNLTSAAFLPGLNQALTGPARSNVSKRFRRDPLGWLLWRAVGPPARLRFKTAAPFIPRATAGQRELIAEFDRWQGELVACVRKAEGLPLDRLWIGSPFNRQMHYNLYSALTILPRHQHRHLWQAEQVQTALQALSSA